MADTMSRSSFLPTIKCSNCGAEIEISMMGDHLCWTAPSSTTTTAPAPARPPESTFRYQNTPPPSARSNSSAKRNDLLKPSRAAPPRIDANAANRPFIYSDQLTPISNSSDSRSVSPATTHDGGHSPFKMPLRSATSPLPRQFRPSSPQLESNLDCAFPPFPTKPLRGAAVESKKAGGMSRVDQVYAEPSPLFVPVSPRTTGGGHVLQRMNTIAPGPFGVGNRRAAGTDKAVGGDQKENTQKTQSPKDTQRPPSRTESSGHARRPSTAGSDKSKRSIGVGRSGSESRAGGTRGRAATEDHSESGLSKQDRFFKPTGASPPRNNSLDVGSEPLPAQNRSRTFPIDNETNPIDPLPRRPTDPSQGSLVRKPSPPGSIQSDKSDDGLQVPRGRQALQFGAQENSLESPSRKQSQSRSRLENIRAAMKQTPADQYSVGNPYHTPTESQSSNGSGYGSDTRTASSRSSPPSDKSRRPTRKPSDTSNIDSLMKDIQSSMKDLQTKNVIPKEPPTVQAPQLLKPPEITRSGRSAEVSEPSPRTPRNGSPLRHLDSKSPQRRPTTAKGNCRGCGEPIRGKSVSSADGRLTGRYHKQCFVCKTCRGPFETATFYVMHNDPYCGRHYHKLNNSLCHACDQGIEGQYLETEKKQKFHKYCFACHECRKVLRDDYYDHNGKAYCERHAMRLAQQQSSLLGPGRRNPERRTTTLMTMMI